MQVNRSNGHAADRPPRKYRFGFILGTTIGNMTRYQNLRKFAERDCDVEFLWTPVNHYIGPSAGALLRRLPRPIGLRLWVLIQMMPGLRQLGRLDVVMVHLFEAEIACVLRGYLFAKPALVSSTDEAPIVDRANYPLYPNEVSKPIWRQRFRVALDKWRARRMDCFIPFTEWGGNILERGCAVPRERIFPIHVGLDLDVWTPRRARDEKRTGLFKMLFVGADFVRKGGDLLLQVFRSRFAEQAELHLVTNQAPDGLRPNVHVHGDLKPNDPRLVDLYAYCDVLVLPTTADLVPWAFLEAMAMECPAIGTDVGAIPNIIEHGVTGLVVPKGDGVALGDAVQHLLDDPALCRRMGQQGRTKIERHFNAEVNVPKILAVMKSIVDKPRAGAPRLTTRVSGPPDETG